MTTKPIPEWHDPEAALDKRGLLYIRRGGSLILQQCCNKAHSWCGWHCPKFSGPDYQDGYILIGVCGDVLRFATFLEGYIPSEKGV